MSAIAKAEEVCGMWVVAACGSALFAGLVAVLGKLGVQTTDSDVATAVRTCGVLVMAWAAAALAGSIGSIGSLSLKTWIFLVLSGLATGASWICYFKALSLGDVNKVVPIDKSSAVLAALLAIVLFGETANLAAKLVCIAVILAGTLMMVERKDAAEHATGQGWLAYAVLAAVFAALTAILGKIGIDGVESNLGTAIRTCVVLAASWGIVVWKGKAGLVGRIDRRELVFLVLSGLATGASWLCYYFAVQTGVVSVVVQIDKLSVLVSIAFAWLALGERLSRRAAIGLVLLVAGTTVMTIFA
ncbi:MAG: EamA family transporter [Eggerthellaceae bacterium]|nr:EamA family transporter [Eggerthellaceae bacterium]